MPTQSRARAIVAANVEFETIIVVSHTQRFDMTFKQSFLV